MAEEREPVTMIVTPVRCEYRYTPGKAAQTFLHAMKEGRILGLACDGCGRVYVPARGACARCGLPASKPVERPGSTV